MEFFAARLCGSGQLDGLVRAGDDHVRTAKKQRVLHADLRAADRAGAVIYFQPTVNSRFRTCRRGHDECPVGRIDSNLTLDRAVFQRQAVIGFNIAGDTVTIHVDSRRDGSRKLRFVDIVKQRDFILAHFVQSILHCLVLGLTNLRNILRLAAVTCAVLAARFPLGESRRGQERQAERERQK